MRGPQLNSMLVPRGTHILFMWGPCGAHVNSTWVPRKQYVAPRGPCMNSAPAPLGAAPRACADSWCVSRVY